MRVCVHARACVRVRVGARDEAACKPTEEGRLKGFETLACNGGERTHTIETGPCDASAGSSAAWEEIKRAQEAFYLAATRCNSFSALERNSALGERRGAWQLLETWTMTRRVSMLSLNHEKH